jgi:hypothetical protein
VFLISAEAPASVFFALIAAGMVTFGALTALFVARTPWRAPGQAA